MYHTLQTGVGGLWWVAGMAAGAASWLTGYNRTAEYPRSDWTLLPGAIGGLLGARVGDMVSANWLGYSPYAVGPAAATASAGEVLLWSGSVFYFSSLLANSFISLSAVALRYATGGGAIAPGLAAPYGPPAR